MGNCTSKKSLKLSKITLSTLPLGKKMDKNQGSKNDVKGLSKVAPTSKGEATSFGFKRQPGSGIPAPARAPVTLTSRVNEMRQDAQSGSSVESLCHVANSSSPVVSTKAAPSPTPSNRGRRRTPSPGLGAANRFGFRSATPPKAARQSPGARGLQTTPRSSPATSRSRSAVGAREARAAFFKDVMQPCPSGSTNSIVESQVDVANARYPGKFWLQTNQLPRPQYPIRLQEKAFKTHANTCRRDGDASRDNSVTDDSGVGSQPTREFSDTDTLHGFSDSSPTSQTRGRPARKLEMRIVSENKFELLDKNEGRKTTTPFVKAPRSAPCTGLVQQRTQQYLERISAAKDSNRTAPLADCSYMISPGASTESEEEKLTRDACRSEKNRAVPYLMSEGSGENDELLPGEAMADEITLSFSSDDDFSVCKYESTIEAKNSVINNNAVAIRSDALRLSNQLRRGSDSGSSTQMKYSCSGLLNAHERAVLEEDALLELSSESETSAAVKNRTLDNCTPLNATLNTSTESPGTPSNGSMSEGRDFLIDDEIADQPQLCFSTHEDLNLDKVLTENNNNSDIHTQNIHPIVERTTAPEEVQVRRVSVGTLSPCESLLSDDLMMEFENSDDNIDRLGGSLGDNVSLDGRPWDSTTRIRSSSGTNGKIGGSASGSPASHKSGVSRASTDEDLSLRLDKATCQHMFQDIVSIKAMLLKLNKVLSEGDDVGGECFDEDPTLDLKKQVAFLQQQLQQRENSVQMLQAEVNRAVDGRPHSQAPTLCNAATQTDKVRPASTAPSALHSLPSDSNVVTNGTNGSNKKVAEWIEDNNRRESMMRIAPAERIMEKVKELNFIPVDEVKEPRTVCKNVFKITKIDLVLKSDNYGQKELLRKS